MIGELSAHRRAHRTQSDEAPGLDGDLDLGAAGHQHDSQFPVGIGEDVAAAGDAFGAGAVQGGNGLAGEAQPDRPGEPVALPFQDGLPGVCRLVGVTGPHDQQPGDGA